MAEFYVKRVASGDSGHLVHDKDCNAINPVQDFIYLGSYSTAEAAFKKAAGYFDPVSYCPDCLKK